MRICTQVVNVGDIKSTTTSRQLRGQTPKKDQSANSDTWGTPDSGEISKDQVSGLGQKTVADRRV